MKFLRFTLISLALLVGSAVYACYFPTYTPGEYYVFYSYPVENTDAQPKTDANIKDWRKLIGNQASLKDIEEVVYRYSLAELENILLKKEGDINSFVKYLQKKKDTEIVHYLLLAKRCEMARAKRNDKWWYPTKEDLKNIDLQEILQDALAYKGSRLKNRYLLQAMRAAYTMKNHELCLDLWEKQIKNMSPSAVKTICQGYIGGIYFQRGDYEKAIKFYNEANDQASFWWCAKYLTKKNSYMERIKILYQYQPSSEELAVMIQNICRDAEERANNRVFNNKKDEDPETYKSYCTYETFREDKKQYRELRDFALRVAAEKRSDNPAMWQYAAAFLTFLDGKTALAIQQAEKAAELEGTPFIKEKIKVLQIMLHAHAAKNYDANFEAQILPQLQWLDSLIVRDINVKNREGYDPTKNQWRKNTSIKETYSDGDAISNYSQYYPFDMMRKIVLSVMLPKYRQQKDYTKALLLAGMASERMRSLVNFKPIGTYYNETYNSNYSTDIFNYMNEFSVENVIEYQQLLQSGGRNEFERFLISKCYKNDDYLNELIGTKYLRLEKFEEAIPYLSNVSDKYMKSMNVYCYFHYNPFREVYENRKSYKPYPAYKLNFAKKMLILQQKMQTEQNKEKNAAAMWQYAIALERSVTNDESWALTTYYMGAGYDNYGNTFNNWQKPLLKRSEKLIAQAGKTMQNSKNPAVRAKYDWYKNVESSFYPDKNFVNETYIKFTDKYRKTSVFQQYLSECDNLYFYYEISYIPQYMSEKWAYN